MDSDSEFIDDSIVSASQHRTVFVAGSEDDSEDEGCQSNNTSHCKSLRLSLSNVDESATELNNEEDTSRRGSIQHLQDSMNNVAISSSDEDEDISQELSPVFIPGRPKQDESSSTETSFIGKRTKKRIMLVDSDTDNSIIVEHNKNKKMTCLKDTPLKCTTNKDLYRSALTKTAANKSSDYSKTNSDDDEETSSEEEEDDNANKVASNDGKKNSSEHDDNHVDSGTNCDDDDDEDEEVMVFSKATRMSIMGVVPRNDEDSDDSDFIVSDESNHKSIASSTNSLNDLPNIELSTTLPQTPLRPEHEQSKDIDSSRISCSPFASPLHDVTNNKDKSVISDKIKRQDAVIDSDDVIIIDDNINKLVSKNRVSSLSKSILSNKENEIVYDEDVTIIDSKPEVIALSSDDEEEDGKKSPRRKVKSVDPGESKPASGMDMKKYLMPESYPNQVVYVKKHVRDNELSKLEGLKADLHGVKVLLEKMDPRYLPDTGRKLGERLASLEKEVRIVGTKVANMVVEPDDPTPEQMKADGFGNLDTGLKWEDIQAASNAVQPRYFGKQGMATHMAERNLILERLRLLHESLASRPAESVLATPPRALKATLLPHQAHALAWLQWRETQRPAAGILADDMGLGKTITMIALIAADKERASTGDSDDDDEAGSRLMRGGTLVVCPASLIQQWANEVKKHCKPHQLSVCLHHGANRAKQAGRLAHNDMVLTTYNILQRDGDEKGVLGRILWRRIILDEAHVVRNHKSITSNAVCNLKGSRRWCLTGTPVQNKDLDLFALVKFMRCSPFDDLVMWKKWIDNKSHGGEERMSTIMQCLLLRRSKAQLQQRGQLTCLPPRTPHLRELTLSQQEMNVYQKVLVFSKTLFAQFLHQRAEKQNGGSGLTVVSGNTEYDKMHKKMIALQGAKPVKSHEILVLLLRLRQVCCHCGLIAAMLDHSDEVPEEDPGSQDLLAELNKLSLDDSRTKVSVRKPAKFYEILVLLLYL